MDKEALRPGATRPHAITFTQPSMAKQSFKGECDINTIMKRFEKDAVLEHVSNVQGRYGDFTAMPGDFQEAMALVTNAREMFLTIPARIRERFHNDPGEFLDFAQDPENESQLRELGLLPPLQTDAPSGAPGGPQAAPEPPPGGEPPETA